MDDGRAAPAAAGVGSRPPPVDRAPGVQRAGARERRGGGTDERSLEPPVAAAVSLASCWEGGRGDAGGGRRRRRSRRHRALKRAAARGSLPSRIWVPATEAARTRQHDQVRRSPSSRDSFHVRTWQPKWSSMVFNCDRSGTVLQCSVAGMRLGRVPWAHACGAARQAAARAVRFGPGRERVGLGGQPSPRPVSLGGECRRFRSGRGPRCRS